MLVRGSNYVRMVMVKLWTNKNQHRYRRACMMRKNELLENMFYVLRSKDRLKQWNQYTHKRTYSIFTTHKFHSKFWGILLAF